MATTENPTKNKNKPNSPPKKRTTRRVSLKLHSLREKAGDILTPEQAASLIAMKDAGFKITNVLARNLQASTRHILNQGGTGSSKTMSLCQLFILLASSMTGQVFSIARKTMPALRMSAMRDFIDLLLTYGLYKDSDHNKSDNIYHLNGNEIEFFGLDEPQKVRGRKRDFMWCNEANEFGYGDFKQLQLRTRKRIYLDYNPSEEVHWIYDKVLSRADCTLIESNYRDNPFLEKAIVEEIERLKEEDENLWKVFGLGQVGRKKKIIYSNWTFVDDEDWGKQRFDEIIYGLDFGYSTNPAALVAIGLKGESEAWIDERLYQRGLTNPALAMRMDEQITESDAIIIADSAEPKSIDEIRAHVRVDGGGFNVLPCMKGEDSVNNGISNVQRRKLFITKRSANVVDEITRYSYKTDRDGNIFFDAKGRPSPVAFKNHTMDAIRYPIQYVTHRAGTSILFEA